MICEHISLHNKKSPVYVSKFLEFLKNVPMLSNHLLLLKKTLLATHIFDINPTITQKKNYNLSRIYRI